MEDTITSEIRLYKRKNGQEFLNINGDFEELSALLLKAYNTDNIFHDVVNYTFNKTNIKE